MLRKDIGFVIKTGLARSRKLASRDNSRQWLRDTRKSSAMGLNKPVLLVENDVWARLIGVVLDPNTSQEKWDAFADFMSPDLSDFRSWCDQISKAAGSLYPSDVRLVSSQAELHSNLDAAEAIVTEGLNIGAEELAAAPRLKVVHKYGMLLRNIDVAACKVRGVKVLSVRRRANVSCAEHAFALMLALARQTSNLNGIISVEQLAALGWPYVPFDTRYTPGANWGRFSGIRTLSGTTLGIIGLGEIGREIATRAGAFDMTVLYTQRTRLPKADEDNLKASYRTVEALLASSDVLIPQLPLELVDVELPQSRAIGAYKARSIHRERIAGGSHRPQSTLGGVAFRPPRRLCARFTV